MEIMGRERCTTEQLRMIISAARKGGNLQMAEDAKIILIERIAKEGDSWIQKKK